MVQNGSDLGANSRDYAQRDAEILRHLGMHPNATKEDVAAVFDLPLAWVTTRIQGMHARGAIRVRPVLDISKAGRIFVFCKLAINTSDLNGVLRELAKRTEFVTVASILGGRYNAFVYFTFGEMADLHDVIRNILMKISDLVDIETSIISDSLLYNPLYIDYSRLAFKPNVEENVQILKVEAAKCGLDELDISIISELQCDERKSLRAIARDYKVSPGTVRYRVQRLESEGIIGFISVLDPKEIGLNSFMILEIRIDPGATAKIVEHLSGKPWLGHLMEVVGASDLIAFVNTSDMLEAQSVISDHLRSAPGIRTVDVRILRDVFKLDPRWGFLSTGS